MERLPRAVDAFHSGPQRAFQGSRAPDGSFLRLGYHRQLSMARVMNLPSLPRNLWHITGAARTHLRAFSPHAHSTH